MLNIGQSVDRIKFHDYNHNKEAIPRIGPSINLIIRLKLTLNLNYIDKG